MLKKLYFSCCFFIFSLYSTQNVYIIVPGTWSAESGWHSEGGDFFECLKKSVDQETTSVMTYYWSGNNNHKSREHAAQGLANLIQSFPEMCIIHLVTHSHGSNVGILASQLLSHNKVMINKIHAFFAFGTPVNQESYFPDMNVIHHFYNFFSYSDFVQTVLGTFQRIYPDHDRVANISVTINSSQPNHDTIHHPIIAQWLPKIHECLPMFDFKKPSNIAFFSNKKPEYYIEHNRNELLEEDFYLTQSYNLVLQGRNNDEIKT